MEADRQLQSWTHWDLPGFGRTNPALNAEVNCESAATRHCMLNLVRPYAQAVAGEPLSMRFDPNTHAFVFAFKPDPSIGAPTELFLPPYRYPDGYQVQLEPADAFSAAPCPTHPNKLCVSPRKSLAGRMAASVTVTVTRRPA